MQAGTFEYANGVIGPDTVTALGIVTGCQRYNRMAFTITGLTTETISVNVSFDYDPSGSGTWAAAAVRPIDMATGALVAASALTNGTFLLVNTPWRAIRFVKTATTDPATVRWGILNAN